MKKLFRKIHLWLSVPFGIFITLICFSGAMLVFEKEITEWCRPDLYYVKEIGKKPLPLDSLMRKVSATLPDSVSATSITVSSDTARTWQVSLSKPRRASVYVNPYTGEVTGHGDRLPFYDTMFHLHRWLMGTSSGPGKLIVGLSTLMLVIILLTGILMWLSNRKKPLRKSLTISFTKGWFRFWHDLHVAGGIYATIFLLAMALTGLTWSFDWYRTGFYGLFGVEASAGAHGGHKNGHTEIATFGRGGHHVASDSAASAPSSYHRGGRGGHHAVSDSAASAPSSYHRGGRGGHRAVSDSAVSAPLSYRRGGRGGHRVVSDSAVSAPSSYRRGGRGGHRAVSDSAVSAPSSYHRGGRGGHRVVSDSTAVEVVSSQNGESSEQRVRSASPRKQIRRKASVNLADTARERRHIAVKADVRPPVLPFAHWQQVFDTLAAAHHGYRQITVSDGKAGVVPGGRTSLRAADRFVFDNESGKITGSTPYSAQDKSILVRGIVYMVHVGSWGGLFTRILAFLAAFLGAILPLTGYYLWIRRLRGKSKRKQ